MTMPAELKARWVEALRSGDYHQCQNVMFMPEGTDYDEKDSPERNCCLGVLRHLATGSHDYPEVNLDDDPDADPSTLPIMAELFEWQLSDDDVEKLAAMNDKGDSFKKIASYIEGRKTL